MAIVPGAPFAHILFLRLDDNLRHVSGCLSSTFDLVSKPITGHIIESIDFAVIAGVACPAT